MTHPPQNRRTRFLAVAASAALLLGLTPSLQASAADPVNLGLNRPVTAGQEIAGKWGPELAFDGDPGPEGAVGADVHNAANASRWSSPSQDNVSIQVDLGNTANITEIKTHWGNTYSNQYSLEGSVNGSTWTPLTDGAVVGPASKGAWTTWTGPVDGYRHIKLSTSGGRNQAYGISIWEIQVMGALNGPIIEPPKPAFVDVIPRPASFVETDGGAFQLTDSTPIVAAGDALSTANLFANTLRASTGFALPVAAEGSKAITLELAPATEIGPEGYELTSTADGVNILAADRAGLFYGTQTLLQLLGPWSRSADAVVSDWTVAALDIEDAPRFGYRGFMIDPVRSFYEVDEVKRIIDQQAAYKMNVLHMHLSDDQGWRIAITNEDKAVGDDIDYSLLTSISGGTAVSTTQWTNITGRTGFYTAADFAEIVAYADARNIAIVPEIDGPAHSNAILHAIPQLNTTNSFPKLKAGETTVPANTTTSVGESSLDAKLDATYVFMKHVMADILKKNTTTVHGTKYFHLGGDESHNTGVQDYRTYMDRASDDAIELGAVPIVWNEGASQASAQLPPNTVVQHWTGGGVPATTDFLNAHPESKLIASIAQHAYSGQRPGSDVVGPSWACGQGCGINNFYNWNPSQLFNVSDDKVLGVVTAHWSEHTRSEKSLEFQIYPRMMVTAEVGWTPQAERNIVDFRKRVASLGTSLTATGRNFYPTDGEWEANAVPLVRDGLKSDTNIGDIAVGSMPRIPIGDVSAKFVLDGTDHDVDVSVAWKHMINNSNYDNRQANGLFTFALAKKLAGGTHTGDLIITANDAEITVPLTLVVEAVGTDPTTNPTVTVSATVTSSATATETATTTATATSSATVTATSSATVTETSTTTATATATTSTTVTATQTVTTTVTPTTSPTTSATTTATPGPVDVYSTPGLHFVNGRHWWTRCEPYSQTTRCFTDIWGTKITKQGGSYVRTDGWMFNNLTYLPSKRALWESNPLGNTGEWTATDGRKWRTQCDTPATGRNGCRSEALTTVIEATRTSTGTTYRQTDKWVLNNIVRFS